MASPGIAIGKCFRHQSDGAVIPKQALKEDQIEPEIKRLNAAIASARNELEQIRHEADRSIGPQLSKIFEAQLLILDDEQFLLGVTNDIAKQKLNCEYVYNRHLQHTLKSLESSHDSYLREMANDINATAAKVFGYLLGSQSNRLIDNRQKIALAEDFSPGEVVLMDKYDIPGFATVHGGPTSHMSLIAKSLGMPAVVGVGNLLKKAPEQAIVVIDGDNGTVVINPSEETLTQFRVIQKKQRVVASRQLKSIARLPSTTNDGRAIEVLANLEIPTEIDQILSTSKVGVGLYRTEFFYLSAMKFPSEDEQAKIYHEIARTFFPNMVTMRTFDLGSDKITAEFAEAQESNPALGWRGIRFDLDTPEIFRAQIRALLKASEFRNLKIMLPMISTAMEIIKAKRVVQAAMSELRKEKIPFDEEIEIGIMIEVPSAALMANELAKHVNFFSICTNDLVQYTLAVDRGNKKVAPLFRELHPSVLKLIKQTIDAGLNNGINVAMCGELAGKSIAVPLLVGLGLTTFSVGPQRLPDTKRVIANLKYSDCAKLASRVMSLSTAERVEAVLHDWFKAHLGNMDEEE